MGQERGVSKKDCPIPACCKSATPKQSFNEPTSRALCTVCGLLVTVFILLDLKRGFIPQIF